ncbi:hypothetical protein BGX34_007874, partial [Mortierella sp. NVP85]
RYIAETEVKRINKELKNFSRDEREFKNSFSEIVHAIQTGDQTEDSQETLENELLQLFEEFEDGCCSSSMVDTVIESYQALSRRISFIRHCEKANIKTIPRGHAVSNYLSPSPTDKIFILLIPKSVDYTTVLQSHDWHIFQLMREDNEDATFMIHDASISLTDPHSTDLTKLAIHKYFGSKRLSDEDTFRASILRPTTKLSKTEPMNQEERSKLTGHALRMPCPLSHEGDCHA